MNFCWSIYNVSLTPDDVKPRHDHKVKLTCNEWMVLLGEELDWCSTTILSNSMRTEIDSFPTLLPNDLSSSTHNQMFISSFIWSVYLQRRTQLIWAIVGGHRRRRRRRRKTMNRASSIHELCDLTVSYEIYPLL